jgi:catechol 2,3-dioxygenase-like lactoylglutathione lyase family enzyme
MRLHHVSIPVPPGQLDAGREFYSSVGLREIPPPEAFGSQRVVWFDLGGCELHLYIEENTGVATSRQHLAIAVDNISAVRERLETIGVPTEDDDPIPNRPRFFFRDPFGNRVEVTEILGPYR